MCKAPPSWLDYEGKRQKYYELAPNTQYIRQTYSTHPWVVTTRQGRCIRTLFGPGEFVIR
ncbi:MAG: hypothetical protein JST84_00045 [Acidobacteria bacterium]|nr:hypothetical protein [Acidobacteriota bacterium]